MNTFTYLLITIGSLFSLVIVQIILFRKFGSAFVQNIGDGINQLLGKETVKRAMTIVGKQGGDAKAVNAITNKIAKGFINENYGLIKIVAEKLGGVDFDELIDDYGAENILVAIQKIAPTLGIDINQMVSQFTSGQNINTSQPIVYPREE